MAKIGIIGTGAIGGGFARLLAKGGEHTLLLHNRRFHSADQLAKEVNGRVTVSVEELLGEVEYVIVAIKPQNLEEFVESHGSKFGGQHVVLSMLGATSLAVLREGFSAPTVVRLMPNIPLFYGEGVLGVAEDASLPDSVRRFINETFSPHGMVSWVVESKMDGLAALAGSGPGLAMVLLEAWTEAGVAMGFPAEQAKGMALQTLKGSMKWAEESGQHPAALKWQVCSPGGTTIQGVQVLEEEGVRTGIVEALFACYDAARGS